MIDLKGGKQIHGYTVKLGSNLVLMVANMLLSMYAKCGIPDDATKFFEEMSFKDSVSYSALISGCIQNGSAEEKALYGWLGDFHYAWLGENTPLYGWSGRGKSSERGSGPRRK